MKIAGYLRTSLLEWPGKISSVLFTPGCNFRCPFCHNADLVKNVRLQEISEQSVLEDLKSRKRWIDGAVFSIHGDEPVVIKKEKELLHLPIKNIWTYSKKPTIFRKPILHEVKTLKGIKCLTKDGFKKVDSVLRHKVRFLYKIVCGPGNYSVLATGGHSIFTVSQEGLIAKRISHLRRREWALSPKKIVSEKELEKVSVLDYVSCLQESEKIRQEKIAYWQPIVSQIGRKTISQLSREYHHSRKTIRGYLKYFKSNFAGLLSEWIVERNFIRHKTSKCRIPTKIKLNPAMGELLGYAVAEGLVRRKRETVSNYIFTLGDEPGLARRILDLYRNIFYQKSGIIRKIRAQTGSWQYSVILGNRVTGELIGNLVGKGFANKHVPKIIFNASTETKISFIKALILGDGHTRVRQAFSQHEYSLKTASKKLAADFIFLLKTIGISSWVEEDSKSFRIVVSQNDLEKLAIISPLNLKYRFKTRVEGIPRELLAYGLRGQKRIRREKLIVWETLPKTRNNKQKAAAIRHGLLTSQGKITEKGKRLVWLLKISENWEFKEVRKIERIKLNNPEYVYDLVVEDNHSFVGGTGGLLLHNTGGEPTLQSDLPEFMAKLKQLGLEVMMETNGSRPETIRTITDCELRILDYLSLDFKTRFVDYPQVVRNRNFDVKDWQKSLQLIVASKIPFEIRTTIVPIIHHQEVLTEMAQELNSQLVNSLNKSILPIWYWQPFVPRNCLDPKFNKIKPYAKIEIEKFLEAVKKFPFRVKLR